MKNQECRWPVGFNLSRFFVNNHKKQISQGSKSDMPDKSRAVIDTAAASAANTATASGAAVGVVGWLTQINWIGLSGVVVAIAGLLISIHFQRRSDRRAEELHLAKMRALNGDNRPE